MPAIDAPMIWPHQIIHEYLKLLLFLSPNLHQHPYQLSITDLLSSIALQAPAPSSSSSCGGLLGHFSKKPFSVPLSHRSRL
jgi:hypothetical protein